ncbi:MAG TPA: hypothetical protein VJH22_01610 [Candidatus Nanoarchaeia archaeon]|nr:hypothetical protein [Candidatus Nanoarchaeia archaeon]
MDAVQKKVSLLKHEISHLQDELKIVKLKGLMKGITLEEEDFREAQQALFRT